MIEALAFGIMVYFGTELGEYTHEQFKELVTSLEEQSHDPTSGTLIILDEHGNVVFEQKLGASNER